jgi:RNA polymerase sigma-70 factor (sigma-E family)
VGPEDEREYRDFVATRTESLRRFSYLMIGDWHLAEDVTQTALTKLYIAWRRLHDRGELDAYVRRIVVRAVVDERRRARFRRERISEQPPERVQNDNNAMTADRLAVLQALSSMPTQQRAAIVLRYWEDLTIEKTADLLGCPPGTVKSQTARGLQTLRVLLDESISAQDGGPTR